jgi:hypothetical protein
MSGWSRTQKEAVVFIVGCNLGVGNAGDDHTGRCTLNPGITVGKSDSCRIFTSDTRLVLLYPEEILVPSGLRAALRFQCPLRNEQLRGAAGLRFERDGNARDFLQALFAIFRVTPLGLNQ